jgi:hypothetical protein
MVSLAHQESDPAEREEADQKDGENDPAGQRSSSKRDRPFASVAEGTAEVAASNRGGPNYRRRRRPRFYRKLRRMKMLVAVRAPHPVTQEVGRNL